MFNLEIAKKAAGRWQKRQNKRASNKDKSLMDVETPERIAKNLERMTQAVATQGEQLAKEIIVPLSEESSVSASDILDDISKERIIGEPNFLSANFLERGVAVARFVGRVHIRSSTGLTRGFGTGSMISPRLLLTNNHVLETPEEARSSQIEFDYQLDRHGQMLPVVTFALEPDSFFMTDEKLDYTIVAVSKVSMSNNNETSPISNYGWNQLIEAEGKILVTQPVNIIQHPAGETKQLVLQENELIDLLPDFAHYAADTKRGSSGSPVFSNLWEVIALHHSAVPDMDSDGKILTIDGKVWQRSMGVEKIKWVANEGIRISSLVKDVKERMQGLSGLAKTLGDEMLNKEAPNPLEVRERAEYKKPIANNGGVKYVTKSNPAPENSDKEDEASWTIPLEVKVRIGKPEFNPPMQDGVIGSKPTVTDASHTLADAARESVSIDPDYNNRKGFDIEFLGSDSNNVSLPNLSAELEMQAAINKQASGSNRYELQYHHYSVVMNKERGLAFFTAVNIDGGKAKKIRRGRDKWFYDPRIEKNEQIGNELYHHNPLDRGHLVRRLDPAWGESFETARIANDDTFHYTNCSPQHEDFNQGKKIWAGLEDYILNNSKNKDLKVSVFTGPVFSADDPTYRERKIPQQFWKVVTMLKKNSKLSTTAYLLSQQNLIENLEADFVLGEYRTFQVSVESIEELTSLDFGHLKDIQPKGVESVPLEESTSDRNIDSFEQIKL